MSSDHSPGQQPVSQPHTNLQELSEREFILHQSQRIGRIGSWEYRIENTSIFWSDEMYNIFGLEKDQRINTEQLLTILDEDTSRQIVNATEELLINGKLYDLTIQARTPLGYTKWMRVYAFPLRERDRIVGARGICHDITYYKEAEKRLLASENKYRSLFEQASDAILIFDNTGQLLEVNSSLCKMLSFSKEELLTRTLSYLVGRRKRRKCDQDRDCMSLANQIFHKGRLRRKNGSWIEVEATVKKFDSNRIMAIVRDVTQLRKVQRRIQISEARFRSAFEFSAVGMALISLRGKVIKVNRQLSKIVGYSQEDLLRQNVQTLTHPDDIQKDHDLVQQTIRGEIEAYKVQKRFLHKNGGIVWVNASASIVRDNHGSPLYFVSQMEDITEEKRSKERLIESEEQLRLFVEHNPASLAMFDREMRYLNVSRRWMTDYNLGSQSLVGKSHYEVFPTIPQAWKDVHKRCLDGAIEKNEEDYFVREDGTIDWVRWEIHPWTKASGELGGIIMFTEVLTEQKSVKEKFTKAFELSPDLMVIVREKDFVFVEANKRLEEIAGFKPDEVIGYSAAQKNFELWPKPEERATFLKEYQTHQRVFCEAQLRKKNGETFHASISAQRIILSGEFHMIAIIRNITQRKHDQEKLLLSQANLNATINNTEIHIWSVDRNFDLLMFNKPFARHMAKRYGISLAVGAGVFGELQTPVAGEMARRWEIYYRRALGGEIVSFEDSEGEETFQYSLSPIIEEDKTIGVTVIAEDISERKRRDRELAEANKKIGELKLMALRAVMNPHFVFNVLSSIQFFIARNDKVNAIQYLSTFSRLIRGILTHSVKNSIRLSDEVEMLKNYVQLEMTRFEGKFDFMLNIQPGVDTDSISVPSLLIQPYVENAILHGLYNKKGRGLLSISIQQSDDSVIFEIEDNGIGREEAMKLKKLNSPAHKSMGSKLTEERLKLINEQSQTVLDIVDLKKDGVPSGTRVSIRVAL